MRHTNPQGKVVFNMPFPQLALDPKTFELENASRKCDRGQPAFADTRLLVATLEIHSSSSITSGWAGSSGARLRSLRCNERRWIPSRLAASLMFAAAIG